MLSLIHIFLVSEKRGTHLAHRFVIHKYSCKILLTGCVDIPTVSAISLTLFYGLQNDFLDFSFSRRSHLNGTSNALIVSCACPVHFKFSLDYIGIEVSLVVKLGHKFYPVQVHVHAVLNMLLRQMCIRDRHKTDCVVC